jgi:hypothetical protein
MTAELVRTMAGFGAVAGGVAPTHPTSKLADVDRMFQATGDQQQAAGQQKAKIVVYYPRKELKIL